MKTDKSSQKRTSWLSPLIPYDNKDLFITWLIICAIVLFILWQAEIYLGIIGYILLFYIASFIVKVVFGNDHEKPNMSKKQKIIQYVAFFIAVMIFILGAISQYTKHQIVSNLNTIIEEHGGREELLNDLNQRLEKRMKESKFQN